MHRGMSLILCSVLMALSGCASPSKVAPAESGPGGEVVEPQAISLLGKPLYSPELSSEVRSAREQDRYEAQLAYDHDLHDETAIIWLGRRQAYLGEYRAAIDTFSNGLAILPDSVRLLRHRGHRYITLREFDKAIVDLSRAAELIDAGAIPDEIEPDGQPNARNIPTSTLHTNIFYHLGLAHYLCGEWSDAATAYRRCLDASGNDDMRVAAAYWLFLSLLRAGQASDAQAVLQSISSEMDIIENDSYWKLLLVFKGELDPQTLQPGEGVANDATIDLATIGYGLGVRDLIHGDKSAAEARFREIIADTNWAAFGHIAAEAELARMQTTTRPH